MTVEAAMYSVLAGNAGVTALVGGSMSPRIYPLGIPQGKSVPAIVYQQVTSGDIVTVDGPMDPRTDYFQVTCWDDNPDGARSLAEAVRTALTAAAGSHGSVTVHWFSFEDEGDISELEIEIKERYGKRQDWIVCYSP
jgi:hypothetical protein